MTLTIQESRYAPHPSVPRTIPPMAAGRIATAAIFSSAGPIAGGAAAEACRRGIGAESGARLYRSSSSAGAGAGAGGARITCPHLHFTGFPASASFHAYIFPQASQTIFGVVVDSTVGVPL